ncbi:MULTISPECIES: RHS repeat domain-containing protein [Cysteiniphilum]|uniref:RHS repeat domain-containing protein n=1 Tax=Cysteiniphilum TaxID=2056696 RepID=UPI0017813AF5|nr:MULTISPECIES: RHS repeat-associated core domain-containing protein [Cysteiniphilum]
MQVLIFLLSSVLFVTNIFAAQYHYDANGNMIEDNYGNLYAYSAENQLIGTLNTNKKINDSNHYNAEGFRDARNVDGHTIGLIYSDGQLINGLNNQLKSSYLEHDVRYLEGESELRQYRMFANNNSTTLLLSDNLNIESSYNYNAYGGYTRYSDNKPKVSSISTNLISHNPLTYDGEYQDNDSGLIYLRARFYNPNLMHFIQRDSYNLLNRYAFANSDPVNHADPTGHSVSALNIVGGFLRGLGDGLLSGATIGFCSHSGCSVDNYRQLLTGNLSSFGELFNPLAAMVPLMQHSGSAEAWANAVGMSVPNIAIMLKDLYDFSYARKKIKDSFEKPHAVMVESLERLRESNKQFSGLGDLTHQQKNNQLLEVKLDSYVKKIEGFNVNKIIADAAISRRSGINYGVSPVVELYSRYYKRFKSEDIAKLIYASAAWHASFKLPQSVSTAINRVNILLYTINSNDLNQYNLINS